MSSCFLGRERWTIQEARPKNVVKELLVLLVKTAGGKLGVSQRVNEVTHCGCTAGEPLCFHLMEQLKRILTALLPTPLQVLFVRGK